MQKGKHRDPGVPENPSIKGGGLGNGLGRPFWGLSGVVTGSQGKSQKDGQEDQGIPKQLIRRVPLRLFYLSLVLLAFLLGY